MIYVVQPGDTLYSIAARFNTTVDAIARLNQISDPNRIYPGMLLQIPLSCPPTEGFTHIVQQGETLATIAAQYSVTVYDLVCYNEIVPTYLIFPGQSLFVPGQPPSPPAGGQIYIVREGDTLNAIAQRFGVSVASLIELNNIPRPDLIFPGQRLIIPPAGQ
jgi:LysM repeat protein